MLNFFKSPSFHDPALGEFARSGGHWRGKIELAGAIVPLALAGSRSAPDAQALLLARTIATNFSGWRPVVAQALFEHYQPYAEALSADEPPAPGEGFPRILAPAEVWSHITWVHASVTPFARVLTIELGLTTAWDEEHTLGARFQDGRFLELCGSV